MNPLIWLAIWIITLLFPTNQRFAKNGWRIFIALMLGLLFGIMTMFGQVIDVHMIWLLVFVKGLMTTVEWFCCHESYDSYDYGYRGDKKGSNSRRKYKYLTFLASVFLILLIIIGLWQSTLACSYNNAVHFNDSIIFMPDGTQIFQKEIPNNMLRLTTDELARNIVLRNVAQFGSNVKILSNHITVYNNRLVWVATIGSSDLWTDNKIRGFVIVDANNPEVEPEVIKMPFRTGEGLIWFPPFHDKEITGRAYGADTSKVYGRAYLTPNDKGEWKYVMTAYSIEQWSFVERPIGVYVYGKNGDLEKFYKMDEIPSWITQMYDENWMENMVESWGEHKRGEGFDVWAGGFPFFVNPSNDRVEISDDTRFIIDPDTNDIVALIFVDPVGSEIETLAGMFKFSREGIQYYNLRPYNIMSGVQAQDVIESHIIKPTTGDYNAYMPMLYSLNGSYAWFVPIYWESEAKEGDNSMRLAGLGIVDADNLDHYAIVKTEEGYKGSSLVAIAKERFLTGNTESSEQNTLSGTLEAKLSYVHNGNTVYILTIDSAEVVVHTEELDFHVVSRIEKLQIGDPVSVLITENYEFIGFQ